MPDTRPEVDDLIVETRRALRDGNRIDPLPLLDAIERLDAHIDALTAAVRALPRDRGDDRWDTVSRASVLAILDGGGLATSDDTTTGDHHLGSFDPVGEGRYDF
jgi:hypothetical protein